MIFNRSFLLLQAVLCLIILTIRAAEVPVQVIQDDSAIRNSLQRRSPVWSFRSGSKVNTDESQAPRKVTSTDSLADSSSSSEPTRGSSSSSTVDANSSTSASNIAASSDSISTSSFRSSRLWRWFKQKTSRKEVRAAEDAMTRLDKINKDLSLLSGKSQTIATELQALKSKLREQNGSLDMQKAEGHDTAKLESDIKMTRADIRRKLDEATELVDRQKSLGESRKSAKANLLRAVGDLEKLQNQLQERLDTLTATRG